MKTDILFWYIVAVLSSAIPLPLIKKYNMTGESYLIFMAIVLSMILIWAYIKILQDKNMCTQYSVIKISSILLVALSGIIFFKDNFNTKLTIGVALGIISIYFLSSS